MRYQLEGQDGDGCWSWSNISADGVEKHTLFDTEEEANAARDRLNAAYARNDVDYDPEGIRVIERPHTVSRAEIHDKIRHAALASMSIPAYHCVWVDTDGTVSHGIDSTPHQDLREYEGQRPCPATVWSTQSVEVESVAEILEAAEQDWDEWFGANVCDLEEKLEPTGLLLVD